MITATHPETCVPPKSSYHHGDLRSALLGAAETELVENGLSGFSLRGAARRAGVSHAAPVHHFRNAEGLLAELAGVGFARLSAMMEDEMAGAATPHERLVASGVAYVDFATKNPDLFGLMFSDVVRNVPSAYKQEQGDRAFGMLQANMKAVLGERALAQNPVDVLTAWSVVHGLSRLIIEGVPIFNASLSEGDRRRLVAAIVERVSPVS